MGGQPSLRFDQTHLTWIDEGATLDGASDNQPLQVMSQLAWAAAATPQELSDRRAGDRWREYQACSSQWGGPYH